MYRVIIINDSTETIIHEPTVTPVDPHLYKCTLTEGSSGEIDSLEFTILPNNPGYNLLSSRLTMIKVVNTATGKEEFNGRVLTMTPEMDSNGLIFKSVVCESRLGFLCDSIQPFLAKKTFYNDGENTGVEQFLDLVLDNHNAQVEDYKKIYRGTVTFTTNTNNITKGLTYETTWETLKSKLLDDLGGEFELREGDDGLLYLDYVTELGELVEDVTIELGKNIKSVSREIDPTSVITRLIPLGSHLESDGDEDVDTDDYVTIASVNNNVLYIDDTSAQAIYGIVEGTVTWEDVTEPSNLLTKAVSWMEQQSVADTITLSAVELSLIGITSDEIKRYNYYRVVNDLIGLDTYFRVVKKTINVCDPSDVAFEMGDRGQSLASTIISTHQTVTKESTARAEAIKKLRTKLDTSSGMFITTVEQEDGSEIYYMHNKSTLSDSDIVWKLTAEAIGISIDGGDTYPYGFVVTGEMIVKELYAIGIDATYITSGVIKSQNYVSGTSGLMIDLDNGLIDCASLFTEATNSIDLSITGSLGNTATIKLSNGNSASLDLSGIRSAFASDSSSIVISAGTVAFESNTLIVGSDQFTLDADGNATFSGDLQAATGIFSGDLEAAGGTFSGELTAATGTFSGTITAASGSSFGGWYITNSAIYRTSSTWGASNGMYFGSNGLSVGSTFTVDSSGHLTCTSATIGGYTVGADSIYSDAVKLTNDGIEIASDGTVENSGTISSSGTIRTKITDDDDTYISMIGDSLYFFGPSGNTGGINGILKPITYAEIDIPNVSNSGSTTTYGMYLGAHLGAKFFALGRATDSISDYSYSAAYVMKDDGSSAGGLYSHTFFGNLNLYNDNSSGSAGRIQMTGRSGAYIYFNISSSASYNADASVCLMLIPNNSSSSAKPDFCLMGNDANVKIYGYKITLSSDTIVSTTAITTSSDARLKTDFTTLANYSGVFDQLLPVSYRFKDSPDKVHFGFTTQDTQAAFMDSGFNYEDYAILGTTEDDDGNVYGTLAYSEIIALLVYEVQELKAQVKTLQALA